MTLFSLRVIEDITISMRRVVVELKFFRTIVPLDLVTEVLPVKPEVKVYREWNFISSACFENFQEIFNILQI